MEWFSQWIGPALIVIGVLGIIASFVMIILSKRSA